jgi:tape measure domain-containing protein
MASTVNVDFNANLVRFTSAIDKATNDLSKFQKNADRITKNISTSFKTLGSGFAIGASFNLLTDISDSYTKLNAQLKNSTRSFAEFGQSFENAQRIASSAQVGVEAIATTYARLSNSLRDFGASQQSIADVAETITLALKVNGATAMETASATLQLSQAFGKGKLDGDEFRSVMEAAPNLMRILAESMKVPVGALKEMSKEGKITSDVLLKAFSDKKVLDGLREQAESAKTISGGYTEIYNQIKLLVGETEKAAGATSLYAKTLSGVAGLIEKIRKGGGVDSGILSLFPGGQAFSVFNQAGQAAGNNRQTSAGTIKRTVSTANDTASQTFEELSKGLNITSLKIKDLVKTQEEAVRSLNTGKISYTQYTEIIAATGKELTELTTKTEKKTKATNAETSAINEFARQQQEVANILQKATDLNSPDLSRADQLQKELDAYTQLNPAVREYVQNMILAAKAAEQTAEWQEIMAESIDREIESFNEAEEAQKSFEDSIQSYVDSVMRAADPTLELADNIGKLQSALSLGLIDPETFDRLSQFVEENEQKTNEITEFWKEAARNMQDAMSDFFFDAMQGKLGDLASSFKATIDRMVANLLASQLTDFLFGADFGKNGKLGGAVGDIFSGGGIGGFFSGLFNANGNAFNQSGLIPFANGGIVSSAVPFSFGGGKLGVMGEAGPEAILPLKRGSNGQLGVQMNGGTPHYINMYVTTPDANSFRKSQPQIMADMQRSLNRGRRVV